MITLKTITYGRECGYTMDSPTYDNAQYFEKKGLVKGYCPSCKQHQLSQIVDLSKLSTHNVIEQSDLDAETIEERNAQGETVRQQVGERYRLNQQTGVIEKVPVELPKQGPLTTAEKTAKLEQAQRNLDELEAIAVQEI